MIAKLIARTGPLAGQDFVLPDTARIGAAKEAEVRIRIEGVSRNHARMYRDGETYWLEDAGSTNGTFLNGQRVQRERLRHLDVVTLGRNVDLVFLAKAGEAPASARPGVLNASFVWLDGPESTTIVEVPRGELTIGRATSCNVVVDSAAVSKVHARIIRSADQVTLQDLGSANGTFVNGKRVTSVMVLTDKDRVGLAGVRNCQVRIERDPSSAAASTADSTPGLAATVFDQEWKTRLVWSQEEMQELEAMRQQARAAVAGAGAATPAEPAKAKAAPPAKPVGERPAAAKPAAPPPPPPRAQPPAGPGAAPAIKAPPPVPPRAAKPDAPAGEAKGPPPLPPRAAKPDAAAGEVKGPPPLPPRAPKPEAPAGDVKGPPPLPPRAKPPEAAGAPPPPAAVKPPPPLPPRNPPASPPGFPAAAQPTGTGTSASDPAPPGAKPEVPRPDQTGADEPRMPRITAPASAKAEPTGGVGAAAVSGVPAPHTSQPPPERRTGPQPVQIRPVAPNEGKPIRAVRLAGSIGTFTLEPGTYTVGRSEKAEIRLDDREVSRAHAIVIVSPTSVSVEDQKSANGTFVNGVEATSRSALRSGDKVMFGSLEFSVEIEA